MTYSVADTDAGYVAAVSYSGEAAPASFVAQEQVFVHLSSLNLHSLGQNLILSSDSGEEGWRSPETRQTLRQVFDREKYLSNFDTMRITDREFCQNFDTA